MSHDIFIREVNEEMRQDRVRALWIRYGALAIALAVLVVLAVGGTVLWQRYQAGLEAADGDRLIAASTLIAENKPDEARTILDALVANGTGTYPDLARMRLAEMVQDKDPAGAVARFDEVANDASVSQGLRDMAAVRAAYILVDTGSLADVRQRVERMTGDGEALRYPAREAIGLAAWKAGDVDTARPLFAQLQDDLGTPQGIKRRATLMIELIAASTAAPAPAATPAAADDAPVTESETPPTATTPAPPAAPTPAPTPPAPAAVAPEPVTPAAPAAPSASETPPTPAAPAPAPAAPAPSETPAASPQPPA